jgi:hypothetical protein
MPCCTLTAFLLSQLALAASAVRARLFGRNDVTPFLPVDFRGLFQRRRGVSLAVALVLEAALAGAAAPYVVTQSGRAAASGSFASAWHLCTVGARIAQGVFHSANG